MSAFTIEPVLETFPNYRVGVLVMDGVAVAPKRSLTLEDEIAAAEAALVEGLGDIELGDVPALKDWRVAYRDFGIKQTKYRSSVERLVRQVRQGRGLPRINGLVDAYNRISIEYLTPIGADDLAHVKGDICFRFAAAEGESFIPLGKEADGEDPPKEGEVVYADAEKVLCRRWNWYQDARSPVTTETERVILTVQGLGNADVQSAIMALADLLIAECDGVMWADIANAEKPTLELP